eukprot:6469087-Amphidinium_carterae.5
MQMLNQMPWHERSPLPLTLLMLGGCGCRQWDLMDLRRRNRLVRQDNAQGQDKASARSCSRWL